MNFEEELRKKTEDCERVILNFLPCAEGYASRVVEAMHYSVEAGGKRLRPLFLFETCRMYGGPMTLAEPFMAALEMIHTYSLVHDDLPSMDNDEYRRGRRTTHVVYGEGMAVLAGDALLNYAYETAIGALFVAQSEQERARVARALRVLAGNAGIYGMVGGQCADLEAEGRGGAADAQTLLYIHKHKTACMIESGFRIGAILAGAPQEDEEKLGKIAEHIGIAFQIQDDILDIEGDSQTLGKATGQDERDGKSTYVTVHGMEKAKEDVRVRTQEALELLDGLSVGNEFLRGLIQRLMTREK
ncbi:MAG: polyprenyl synthetase family protein [Eubacteriales bacterium]|nr:polyprenyl synthetase family protein [Eubacteriales bacterium]